MINSISCLGFRGFATKQTLNLAIPNGNPGSGLTVLVGPNGGGKSTLVECFNKVSLADKNASFSMGKRNKNAGDIVEIGVLFDNNQGFLKTRKGGSETQWEGPPPPKIYYLPSRRFFNPYFGNGQWDRNLFLNNPQHFQTRANPLDTWTYRLVDMNKGDSNRFDSILETILGKPLQWTIDQDDNGQYYVKITKEHGLQHNSDGLGEGVLSLMFIVDALCGANDELLVIDEPELSLHPQLQRRLLNQILEKTRDSQVVISTHSPSMLSLSSILNGGMVARVYETANGTTVKEIDERARKFIASVGQDLNNPHILGTDARACFFAEDSLIITEGQEDVVLYPVVLQSIGMNPNIPFFGFGAGGASRIHEVAHLLHVLGFEKVGAIYDGDKKKDYEAFNREFTAFGYKAWIIPADDIRDKEYKEAQEKKGLLDSHKRVLKEKYAEPLKELFHEVTEFLQIP